jgi:ABC-2 type transport system ATP-binding protein
MDIPAIHTANLGRRYQVSRKKRPSPDGKPAATERIALEGVTLEIQPGELFGLLGPNGAGKTTLIKILTTLLAPSSGFAWVDGLDVVTQAKAIRPRINMVSGGESCGYGILNVRENLWLFSQLYGVPSKEAQQRIDAMLAIVGLTDRAGTRISHLSTGQRQKMNFCRGFITDPKILFLDEPTLGLDVTAARSIRQFIRDWMRERPDRTLLLTTHYMMEADELCNRLAIIDHGKVLACDTPAALKKRVQRHAIFEMAITPETNAWKEVSKLGGVHQCTSTADRTSIHLRVALEEEAVIGPVVQQVVGGGARILSLTKIEPTLEDVFIELVGHGLTNGEDEP